MKFSSKIFLILLAVFVLGFLFGLGSSNFIFESESDEETIAEEEATEVNVVVQTNEGETQFSIEYKEDETVLELMERLEEENDAFSFTTESFDFGEYLTSVTGTEAEDGVSFWGLNINGTSSQVGISEAEIDSGDEVQLVLTEL